MKHFHNLGKIQETESDVIEIENFVSDKELSELNNYTASNKNLWINRDDGQKYCFNFKNSSPVCDISLWNDLFIQILLPKLKKIFKNIDFYVDKEEFPPHIFRSCYPLKVHVDTGKDNSDKIIYKQILIPLKTEPEKKDVYSIFFKNRWYGPAANFRSQASEYDPLEIKDKNGKFTKISDLRSFYSILEKNRNKEVLFNSRIFDSTELLIKKIKFLISKKRYNITTNLHINKEKKFSKEIYEKYLSHCEKEDLDGLDFWKCIKWKFGNAIIWDRTIPHCAGNFLKSDVISKSGLTMFFNRK